MHAHRRTWITELITPISTSVIPLYLAFNYVRNGPENYAADAQGNPTVSPYNGTHTLSANWADNVPVEVAGWQWGGNCDWALLKVPKVFFPLGAAVNQLPVSFGASVTANTTTDLFSNHHGDRYPQRLSVLPKNQYTVIDDPNTYFLTTKLGTAVKRDLVKGSFRGLGSGFDVAIDSGLPVVADNLI